MEILIVESPTKAVTISSFLKMAVFSTCGVFLTSTLSDVGFANGKIVENRKLNTNKANFINDIIAYVNKYTQQQYQITIYLATDIDEQGNEIAFDIADYITSNIVNKDMLIFKRVNLNSITQTEVVNKINNAPDVPITLSQLHQEAKISQSRRIRNAFVANHYIDAGAFGLGAVSASILKTIKDGHFIIGEMNLVIKTSQGNFKTSVDITINNFELWQKRKQQLEKYTFSLSSKMIESKVQFDDLQNFNDIITKI